MPTNPPIKACLYSKLTTLTDLPRAKNGHRCDCGQPACYALPALVQPAQSKSNRHTPIRTELYLCGRCLGLEMQARQKYPLLSDKL